MGGYTGASIARFLSGLAQGYIGERRRREDEKKELKRLEQDAVVKESLRIANDPNESDARRKLAQQKLQQIFPGMGELLPGVLPPMEAPSLPAGAAAPPTPPSSSTLSPGAGGGVEENLLQLYAPGPPMTPQGARPTISPDFRPSPFDLSSAGGTLLTAPGAPPPSRMQYDLTGAAAEWRKGEEERIEAEFQRAWAIATSPHTGSPALRRKAEEERSTRRARLGEIWSTQAAQRVFAIQTPPTPTTEARNYEALAQRFIEEGHSPEEARKLARQKAYGLLQAEELPRNAEDAYIGAQIAKGVPPDKAALAWQRLGAGAQVGAKITYFHFIRDLLVKEGTPPAEAERQARIRAFDFPDRDLTKRETVLRLLPTVSRLLSEDDREAAERLLAEFGLTLADMRGVVGEPFEEGPPKPPPRLRPFPAHTPFRGAGRHPRNPY